MAVAVAVFNYGCPRSGTTFMTDMLQRGAGYLHWRLTEYARLHPCQSDKGLYDLHEAITINARYRHCIVVRTLRHPIEVAKSAWVSWHQGRWRTTPGANTPIALSPERIVQTIRAESVNTAAQQGRLTILVGRYEEFDTDAGRAAFLTTLASRMREAGLPCQKNTALFSAFIAEYWRVKPIGEGRLALGDAAMPVPDAVVDKWRTELAPVIEREGYKESQL